MFNIGDYVVYKRDVCKIKEIKKNGFNNKDYYVLIPIDDNTLIIDVPMDNKSGLLRPIIEKNEVENIINSIVNIPIIKVDNKLIENEYKQLLNSGKHEDLIKVIKTTYLRNKERTDMSKKIGDKDDLYFKRAEQLLYNEFSIALNMNYDDTKKYVIDAVSAIENN